MYKGWKNDDNTYYFNDQAGFVEEQWHGAANNNLVILDPNTSFQNTPNIKPLDDAVIQDAYAHSIIVRDSTGTATGETMYGKALADVSNEQAYDGLLRSIGAINANYQQTCPSVGIEMAENIFAARSTETAGRDKIVVLFTDGVPTVRLLTNRHHGFSDDVFAKSMYWSVSGGVEDALDRAVIAKNNGVQLYTIGTAAMENTTILGTNIDSGNFLDYLSSNYTSVSYGNPDVAYNTIPNDVTYTGFIMNGQDNNGEGPFVDPDHSHTTENGLASHKGRQYAYYDATPDGNAKNDELIYYYSVTATRGSSATQFAQFAGSDAAQRSNDLNIAFDSIMESITLPTVKLDGNAVLKEVVSDYFDLDAVDTGEIQVYVAPYAGFNDKGEHTFGDRVLASEKGFAIEVTFDSYDGRNDVVVNVNGFSYTDNYVRVDAENGPLGYKLIVVVPIRARDGFWGGNNVPTNKDITAIYDDKGNEVQDFPMPEANVPMQPAVTTQDQVIYYGDPNVGPDDILTGVTVDGYAVKYDPTQGKFVPGDLTSEADDWMDDYAVLKWSAGSSTLTTSVSSTIRATQSPMNSGST